MDKKKIQILLAYEEYIYACSFKEPFRTIRKIIRDVMPSFRHMYSTPERVPCDILFVGYAVPMKPLLEPLTKKGLRVCQDRLSASNILSNKMMCEPDQTLPRALLFYDAVMKFLIEKYQPKVVCSFMDHSLLSPFLRAELHHRGGKYINIAHGVASSSYSVSMFDFDYHFLFGQGSVKNILANPVRVGNTRAVLTGSPLVASDYELPPNREKKKILYFSQLSKAFLYSSYHRKPLLENANIVINWAKLHPEFHLCIKIHPAEHPKSMRKLTSGVPNITVLEKSIPMVQALQDVSLVLTTGSNASVEAALLHRPTVVVNKSGLWNDALSFEDFFLPRATTVAELHQNILHTFEHYEEFLQRTHEFVTFHLERTTDSVQFIADCIEAVYHGEENFPHVPIQQELSGLQSYF